MNPRARRATRIAAVLAAGILTLAACGKTKSSTVSDKSSTTAAPAAGSSVAKAKMDAKLGSILATAKGLTVYTLTNGGKAVACTATCMSAWPPVHATGTAVGTVSGAVLSVVNGAAGTQLAAGGLPLYTFKADKDSGDAYGEGIKSFGGTWHVVKLTAESTTPTTGTATTSGSKSGY